MEMQSIFQVYRIAGVSLPNILCNCHIGAINDKKLLNSDVLLYGHRESKVKKLET